MLAVGLRCALLLAILVQYSPVRVCALQRVTLGSNCHDWNNASVGGSHDDERTCGTGGSGDQRCVCEQPKVVGDQHAAVHAPNDFTDHSVVVAVVEEPVATMMVAAPDPDPQRDLLASLQLPLLI